MFEYVISEGMVQISIDAIVKWLLVSLLLIIISA